MARQVERAGFDAVYISGAGMANATAGVPDIGLLTLTEVVRLAGYVANAVKIPAIVDADTGFGGAENVARTIQELEKAGLAGCHIEDQEFPKRCGHLAGKSVVDVDEMVGENQSRGGRASRQRFPDHRANGCASGRGFRWCGETGAELSRSRRRRDFSRSPANAGRVQRFRQGSESAVAREHDGVRQKPAAQFRRTCASLVIAW